LRLALTSACSGESDPRRKMSELGLAYVRFAQSHPALYRVMYDSARAEDALPQQKVDRDPDDNDAFQIVKKALAEVGGNHVSETDIHLAAIAAWCAAHGLAEMSGFVQFRPLKAELGGEEAFLRGVLDHLGMFRAVESAH